MRQYIMAAGEYVKNNWVMLLLMAAAPVVSTVTVVILKIYNPGMNFTWWLGSLMGLVVSVAIAIDVPVFKKHPDNNRYCCVLWAAAGLTGWAIFTLVDATIQPNWSFHILVALVAPVIVRYVVYVIFDV